MFERALEIISKLPDRTERIASITKDGRSYRIVRDYSRLKSSLVELASVLNDSPNLFDDFINLTRPPGFLYTMDVLDRSTDIAIEVAFVLKPTERLLDWLTASGAGDHHKAILVNEVTHKGSD